jgi:hypothetical protein
LRVGIRFPEVLQERHQTEPIHNGQVEAEALSPLVRSSAA